jgi:two-component system cell cycle response regulator DivK
MANELILIVEDNPKNLKLVRDTLQVKGYQTIEAETGEEGVRLAYERHPALILMDIQLPGINGVEALNRLRADPGTSRTPVIAAVKITRCTSRNSRQFGHAAFETPREGNTEEVDDDPRRRRAHGEPPAHPYSGERLLSGGATSRRNCAASGGTADSCYSPSRRAVSTETGGAPAEGNRTAGDRDGPAETG